MERIAAHHQVTDGFQVGDDICAAGKFAQAIDTVVADYLDDHAQGVGGVQAGGVQQRRIGDGDRGDVKVGDTHGEVVLAQPGDSA